MSRELTDAFLRAEAKSLWTGDQREEDPPRPRRPRQPQPVFRVEDVLRWR